MGLGVRSQCSRSVLELSTCTKVFANVDSSCTMLTIFGGRVKDLEPMLFEERFVEGWEPRIRSRFGLTMMAFNGTVLPVEKGIKSVKKELE
jgi:hypothetical protein